MKTIIYQFGLILLATQSLCGVVAFQASPSTSSSRTTSTKLYAVELKPEPEGGEEVPSISTMAGSRMKNMGEVSGMMGGDDKDQQAYKFWLTAEATGALIKDIHTRVLKDASKKANFPGFRKGQVPPYAMPQIRGFAVQEGIIQTVEAAVKAYGLLSLKGSDGEVEVLEDIPEVAKQYKVNGETNVPFTCTFNAVFDPEQQRAAAAAVEEIATVVDAEIVE